MGSQLVTKSISWCIRKLCSKCGTSLEQATLREDAKQRSTIRFWTNLARFGKTGEVREVAVELHSSADALTPRRSLEDAFLPDGTGSIAVRSRQHLHIWRCSSTRIVQELLREFEKRVDTPTKESVAKLAFLLLRSVPDPRLYQS